MSVRKIVWLGLLTAALTITPLIANAAMAPPTLLANALSGSSVQSSWVDPNSKSFGYEVQQSPNGSNFVLIASVSKIITSYVRTGLAVGTTYYFRVRSKGNRGTYSPYSNIAVVTTASPAPPAPTQTATATTTPIPTQTATATVTAVATTTPVPTRTATATVRGRTTASRARSDARHPS